MNSSSVCGRCWGARCAEALHEAGPRYRVGCPAAVSSNTVIGSAAGLASGRWLASARRVSSHLVPGGGPGSGVSRREVGPAI